MNSTLRSIGSVVLVTAVSFSTASGVLASPYPMTGDLASEGTAESNEDISSNLVAEAPTAEKNESGNLLSVTWSIKNEGDGDVFFTWPTGTSYMYKDALTYSGVTVTSSSGDRRFHPVMDGDNNCLCSGNVSIDFKEHIGAGEKVAYWSMYSVPEDVDAITLEIPGFEPIEDIPIS